MFVKLFFDYFQCVSGCTTFLVSSIISVILCAVWCGLNSYIAYRLWISKPDWDYCNNTDTLTLASTIRSGKSSPFISPNGKPVPSPSPCVYNPYYEDDYENNLSPSPTRVKFAEDLTGSANTGEIHFTVNSPVRSILRNGAVPAPLDKKCTDSGDHDIKPQIYLDNNSDCIPPALSSISSCRVDFDDHCFNSASCERKLSLSGTWVGGFSPHTSLNGGTAADLFHEANAHEVDSLFSPLRVLVIGQNDQFVSPCNSVSSIIFNGVTEEGNNKQKSETQHLDESFTRDEGLPGSMVALKSEEAVASPARIIEIAATNTRVLESNISDFAPVLNKGVFKLFNAEKAFVKDADLDNENLSDNDDDDIRLSVNQEKKVSLPSEYSCYEEYNADKDDFESISFETNSIVNTIPQHQANTINFSSAWGHLTSDFEVADQENENNKNSNNAIDWIDNSITHPFRFPRPDTIQHNPCQKSSNESSIQGGFLNRNSPKNAPLCELAALPANERSGRGIFTSLQQSKEREAGSEPTDSPSGLEHLSAGIIISPSRPKQLEGDEPVCITSITSESQFMDGGEKNDSIARVNKSFDFSQIPPPLLLSSICVSSPSHTEMESWRREGSCISTTEVLDFRLGLLANGRTTCSEETFVSPMCFVKKGQTTSSVEQSQAEETRNEFQLHGLDDNLKFVHNSCFDGEKPQRPAVRSSKRCALSPDRVESKPIQRSHSFNSETCAFEATESEFSVHRKSSSIFGQTDDGFSLNDVASPKNGFGQLDFYRQQQRSNLQDDGSKRLQSIHVGMSNFSEPYLQFHTQSSNIQEEGTAEVESASYSRCDAILVTRDREATQTFAAFAHDSARSVNDFNCYSENVSRVDCEPDSERNGGTDNDNGAFLHTKSIMRLGLVDPTIGRVQFNETLNESSRSLADKIILFDSSHPSISSLESNSGESENSSQQVASEAVPFHRFKSIGSTVNLHKRANSNSIMQYNTPVKCGLTKKIRGFPDGGAYSGHRWCYTSNASEASLMLEGSMYARSISDNETSFNFASNPHIQRDLHSDGLVYVSRPNSSDSDIPPDVHNDDSDLVKSSLPNKDVQTLSRLFKPKSCLPVKAVKDSSQTCNVISEVHDIEIKESDSKNDRQILVALSSMASSFPALSTSDFNADLEAGQTNT